MQFLRRLLTIQTDTTHCLGVDISMCWNARNVPSIRTALVTHNLCTHRTLVRSSDQCTELALTPLTPLHLLTLLHLSTLTLKMSLKQLRTRQGRFARGTYEAFHSLCGYPIVVRFLTFLRFLSLSLSIKDDDDLNHTVLERVSVSCFV